MTSSLRGVTLVLLVLTAGALAPAVGASAPEPAADSVGIRLLDAPVDRRDDPRAQTYIVDHLAPGTAIERRVEVSNGTAAAADIELYAAGGDVADGSFEFFEGRATNEVADWTSVDPPTVRVPAGGRTVATVQIDVPRDASAGERYAVVWAELPAADDGDVTAINRVGIRLYLSVGPGGEPAADFTVDGLTARRTADGGPEVAARVRNTGGRALDFTGELALTDGPGGVQAGSFAVQLGTTLGVGDVGESVVKLDPELPDGPWHAELTLRSGRTEHTASATITFPVAGQEDTVAADQGGPSRWWWVALGALVLLIAALGWWLLGRRKPAEETSDLARVPG